MIEVCRDLANARFTMSPGRARRITFFYTCAAISLAAGFFGSLSAVPLSLQHGLVAAASLAASVGLVILAGRSDEWTEQSK